MDVHVEPEGWEAEAAEIQCLLSDVVQQFLPYVPAVAPAHIEVRFRKNAKEPMIEVRASHNDPFPIGLTVRDRLWDQFVDQFAHEFGHILCDYERMRPGCNLWIQESLCQTAALFALKQMAARWQIAAPYPNWREYAVRFADYANRFIDEHRLPNGVRFSTWLRENEATLRGNGYERSLTGLIAAQLLPLFQISPQGWQSVSYLPSSDETFDNFLAEWHRSCLGEHRRIIIQMAFLFGIRITAKFSPLLLGALPVEKN